MGKENKNLSSLKGADKVRKRVGVMLGSDDIKGVEQTVFEIVSNSIDRFKAGFGDIIKVTKHLDCSYTIQDYADGLPMDWNEEEECYNWELALRVLYAGSNYDVSNEDHDGQLGYNGAGLHASIASSEFATVVSKKEDKIFTINLKQGRPLDKDTNEFVCDDNDLRFTKELGEKVLKIEDNSNKETGTTIHYKPDLNIFTDINIPINWFEERFKQQTTVNKGLKIIFIDEETNTQKEYLYENGIVDYLEEKSTENNITDILYFSKENIMGKDDKDKPEYKVSFEIAFRFSNEVNFLEYYHNSSFLEYGGSPDKAVKNAFVYSFDKHMKEKGIYNKGEKKITFIDIQDSLALIINSYSSRTSYENQTKKAITNKFIQEAIQDGIKDFLTTYFAENPKETELLMKQIVVNKRSREKAEKTRINVRKQLTGAIGIGNRVKKFVDCRTKDKTKRELFICEGDSALGSCKLGRNAEFQAMMPIRGKILNCLKAGYDKVFKSDIIIDLLRLFGCGVEVKGKYAKDFPEFNIDNLNYDKIIILTDSDNDGRQIRTLLLTMIYRLCPSLIEHGKVFIVEAPLYEISTKKKEYYAFTEEEKDMVIKSLNDEKFIIQRAKGLGELNPDVMWRTTLNPETRRLTKVTLKDVEYAEKMFEILLGEEVPPRTEYISNNFDKWLDSAE